MLSPDQVTAVIVTRGDVDLTPVLDSLIFPHVIVWDNSVDPDSGTYGRYLAPYKGAHEVIYSQDDDIVHTPENQRRILASYECDTLTGCMWPEWSDGARRQGIENGYGDLVFAGSGSVWRHEVAMAAIRSYLEHFPPDDFFLLWADTIVGVIAPSKQLDIRFDALPCAENDNRMANMPDAIANKTEAIRRGRQVRDLVLA